MLSLFITTKCRQKLFGAMQHEATRINMSAFIKFCAVITELLLIFKQG